MKPTPEQDHILDLCATRSENLIINALAGCGKTSTLELIAPVVKVKPILYLCFNKRIAEEARDKFPSYVSVKTLNSLGHGIWRQAIGKELKLNPKKSQEILREIIGETPKKAQGVLWDVYWEVVNAVGLAKSLGYVPDGKFPNAKRLISQLDFHSRLDELPDDLVSDLIDQVLFRSIKEAYDSKIDFNDQIYMPALFGGTFPRFPLVKVDEAQDLSPTNHAMLGKLAKGRLISVGDPWQSIYGFRGAKIGGMSEMAVTHNMEPCPLSTSFRCPQVIVENARWRVPHFNWVKKGGHVETLSDIDLSHFNDSATIICRNNAPLFRLALRLLMAGHSVNVSGSDIGPKIITIMGKLGSDDMVQATLIDKIEEWREAKAAKESKTANDLADCMRCFAEHGDTLSGAIAYAEHLFAQQGTIRLMTGHKAKGLEFDTVYHLDPWLIGTDEQDLNLRYVIQTRSKDQLFEINSKAIK